MTASAGTAMRAPGPTGESLPAAGSQRRTLGSLGLLALLVRLVVLLFSLAGLAACGPNGLGDRGERYVEAVAVALRVEAPDVAAASRRGVLPRRRLRILELPDHRIGPFDFLALQGCELGRLAGRNMSALGRQMPYSLRLTHELSVLEVSDACLREVEDPERRARLEAIITVKRSERGVHAWNAVWAGSEIEAYLSRSKAAALASSSGAGARAALERLARGVTELAAREAEGLEIERGLERLAGAEPLGRALRDLEVATEQLDAVAGLLEGLDVEGCGPRETRAARAFRTTYLRFVQQPLGHAHRRAADELPALRRLAEASAAELAASDRETPAAMRRWFTTALALESADAIWPRYERAVHRHVAAWAPVLTACGELPGRDRVEGLRAPRPPASLVAVTGATGA